MRKEHTKISPVIYQAIEILKSQFGGSDIKLVSDEMYRLEPDEHSALGKLGVNIQIEGITAFLGLESMAEQIVVHGSSVAQEYIIGVYKTYNNQVNK